MTWRERAVIHGCRWGVRPLLALPVPWTLHRRAFELGTPSAARLPGVAVERTRVGAVPCRIVRPEAGAAGTILWLHGGGFVMGSSGGVYLAFGAALAGATGRRVVLPDYRLAPEDPFPAAPDDTLAVARALAAEGPFALGGDSAGGTLAMVTLAGMLADEAAPERVVLASPAADLDPARPVPRGHREMMLPVAMLRRVARDYAGAADPRDPRLSPIHGDYAGAPPVLIQCARGEILEGDADALAARLRAVGASVTLEKEAGVPHVWQLFAGLAAADRAMASIAAFLAAGAAEAGTAQAGAAG